MPFNYGDGEQERIRAGIEVQIPQSYIKDSLTADFNKNEGKKLYEIMEWVNTKLATCATPN